MNDFYLDLALSVLFSTLKTVIKNEERKAALKKAMLKLRNAIDVAYGDDDDFGVFRTNA